LALKFDFVVLGNISQTLFERMLQTVTFALSAAHVAGHAWLVDPVSKNDVAQRMRDYQVWQEGMPGEFRYCPDCSANGNNGGSVVNTPAAMCGATSAVTAEGLSAWQKWYDAGGIAVPVITPGSDMRVRAKMTADHGGQFWFQLSCATSINENTNWTILERSVGERDYSALPSNPAVYAWPPQSSGGFVTTYYHVPSSFSCPGGVGMGRWLWKTGNTCNDANNIGRNTETFKESEVPWTRATCAPGSPPETFISCFDFKVSGSSSPSPPPAPTQAPQPTQAPTTQAPAPPPAGPGLCCYGGCGGNNCQGGWCGENQAQCEGNCNGEFCPAAAALESHQSLKIAKEHV